MRTYVALLLLVTATICHAADTSSITNKITEIDRDKDGQIDNRIETVHRGEAKVMMTMSRLNAKGELKAYVRSFLVDGQLRMTESDEDNDGFFERLCLYAPDTGSMDLFKRQPDGSVTPVSAAELELWKKMHALQEDVSKAMRSVIEGKTTAEQATEEVLKVREKAEQLKQELQELEKKQTEKNRRP